MKSLIYRLRFWVFYKITNGISQFAEHRMGILVASLAKQLRSIAEQIESRSTRKRQLVSELEQIEKSGLSLQKALSQRSEIKIAKGVYGAVVVTEAFLNFLGTFMIFGIGSEWLEFYGRTMTAIGITAASVKSAEFWINHGVLGFTGKDKPVWPIVVLAWLAFAVVESALYYYGFVRAADSGEGLSVGWAMNKFTVITTMVLPVVAALAAYYIRDAQKILPTYDEIKSIDQKLNLLAKKYSYLLNYTISKEWMTLVQLRAFVSQSRSDKSLPQEDTTKHFCDTFNQFYIEACKRLNQQNVQGVYSQGNINNPTAHPMSESPSFNSVNNNPDFHTNLNGSKLNHNGSFFSNLFHLVILLILAFGGMSCQKVETQANHVALIDYSYSRSDSTIRQDVSMISNVVLANLDQKSRLAVIPIDQAAGFSNERLFVLDVNHSKDSLIQGVRGYKHAGDTINNRIKQYLKKMAVGMEENLLSFKRRKTLGGKTDILRTLENAATLLKDEEQPVGTVQQLVNMVSRQSQVQHVNVIYLFSDGINEDPQDALFDFRDFDTLSEEQVSERLDTLIARRGVPDLKGATVFFHGATVYNDSPLLYERIRLFWILYFDEANARLVSYGSDIRSEIEEHVAYQQTP